jgi:hypothetical protein
MVAGDQRIEEIAVAVAEIGLALVVEAAAPVGRRSMLSVFSL